MPNTANYSFPTPADTDLVKNGADAIRDLGDAVDTAMNTALGTKKSGLVLLNTTSFSGVTSQSINDVFSATYQNYLISINATGSGNDDILFRLRASGSDLSGSNYYHSQIYNASDSSSVVGTNSNGGTSIFVGEATAFRYMVNIDLFSPQATEYKVFKVQYSRLRSIPTARHGTIGGGINVNTAYTGFTFFTSGGTITMTGNVRVYGYNN